MPTTQSTVLLLSLITFVFAVITFVFAKGFRVCYRLLGLYHPTDEDVEKYKDEGQENYETEDWLEKGGKTIAINLASTMVTLMVVLIYGLVFLDQNLTFSAIFGTGIVIVAINKSLRFGSLYDFTDWFDLPEKDQDLVSFGHAFYTSLWVLAVLGLSITILNGNYSQLTGGVPQGTKINAIIWGCLFVVSVITIPLGFEIFLSKSVSISEDNIDWENSE